MCLSALHGTAFGKDVIYLLDLGIYIDEFGIPLDKNGNQITDHRRREWKKIKKAQKKIREYQKIIDNLCDIHYKENELRKTLSGRN